MTLRISEADERRYWPKVGLPLVDGRPHVSNIVNGKRCA